MDRETVVRARRTPATDDCRHPFNTEHVIPFGPRFHQTASFFAYYSSEALAAAQPAGMLEFLDSLLLLGVTVHVHFRSPIHGSQATGQCRALRLAWYLCICMAA